jgi:hypothetical protein
MSVKLTPSIARVIGTHLAKLESAPVNKRFSEGESAMPLHIGDWELTAPQL